MVSIHCPSAYENLTVISTEESSMTCFSLDLKVASYGNASQPDFHGRRSWQRSCLIPGPHLSWLGSIAVMALCLIARMLWSFSLNPSSCATALTAKVLRFSSFHLRRYLHCSSAYRLPSYRGWPAPYSSPSIDVNRCTETPCEIWPLVLGPILGPSRGSPFLLTVSVTGDDALLSYFSCPTTLRKVALRVYPFPPFKATLIFVVYNFPSSSLQRTCHPPDESSRLSLRSIVRRARTGHYEEYTCSVLYRP